MPLSHDQLSALSRVSEEAAIGGYFEGQVDRVEAREASHVMRVEIGCASDEIYAECERFLVDHDGRVYREATMSGAKARPLVKPDALGSAVGVTIRLPNGRGNGEPAGWERL